MAHFKLYQYVFTKPREDKTKHDELLIETVKSPEPFSSGKPQNIWEYEQRLHELDKAAERRHQERELEVQCTKQKTEEALHKSVENVENIEAPLTKEVYLILQNLLVQNSFPITVCLQVYNIPYIRLFYLQKLKEKIRDIAKAHIGAASVSINAAVTNVLEDLEYKLERTSLPRPADLGTLFSDNHFQRDLEVMPLYCK